MSRAPLRTVSTNPRTGSSGALKRPASRTGVASTARVPTSRSGTKVAPRAATSTARSAASISRPASSTARSSGTTRPTTASRLAATNKRRAEQEREQQRSRPGTARSTSSRAGSSSSRESGGARAGSARGPSAGTSGAARGSSTAAKKKRPAWDIKGRLQDLEEFTNQLKMEVKDKDEAVGELKEQLTERETKLGSLTESQSVLQHDLSKYQAQIDELTSAKQTLMHRMEAAKLEHAGAMQLLESQKRALEMELETMTAKYRAADDKCHEQRRKIAEQEEGMRQATVERDEAQLQLEETNVTLASRDATIAEFEEQVREQQERIAELEAKRRMDEMTRRKLHNYIQDLKGNIRVYCRVRPTLNDDDEAADMAFPDSNGSRSLEIEVPGRETATGKIAQGKRHTFTFDKVFDWSSTQSEVFEEISALVQSALDGYNSSIFTYGQTGSGKTYTMEGPARPTEDTRGMIPRAVTQIFETAELLQEQGWVYEYEAFFLEIYNETIRDLLAPKGRKKEPRFDIKHDRDGTTSVTNMTVVPVERPGQVHELLARASENRAVASTNCNERSSRSHSVFQLKIVGRNTITGASATGLLNLIDLAGSERLSVSGSTGDRLKETQAINKSLSALGDVICALANKDSHIPYRNSKLTYLLQKSLGGNSKTLMFVNISPRVQDLNESISSLRFATKVNACEIGIARKAGRITLE